MKNTINYNKKSQEELIKLLAEKDAQIIQHQKQISILEEYVKAHQLRQFANKSEKISRDQISFFDEAKITKDEEKILVAEEEIQVATYQRKKPGVNHCLLNYQEYNAFMIWLKLTKPVIVDVH